MLMFDMAGRVIDPGRLRKTIGGDLDARGIPPLIEIPTTGAYAGVTVGEYATDPYLATKLSRGTGDPGPAIVRGPEIDLTAEMMGFHLAARVFGGGSGSTFGLTRRDFRCGFRSDDGQHGIFVEYRNPDRAESGTFITARSGGSDTRHPINYQINNPTERYAPELWATRNLTAGGWTATLAEGGQIRTDMNLGNTASMDRLRPFAEWDWTATTGDFHAMVSHLSFDIFWRF